MTKKLSKKILQYNAIFEPDDKRGGYTASIPSLPGCVSEGDTFEKAAQNIKEAAELYLEATNDNKRSVFYSERFIIAPVQLEF